MKFLTSCSIWDYNTFRSPSHFQASCWKNVINEVDSHWRLVEMPVFSIGQLGGHICIDVVHCGFRVKTQRQFPKFRHLTYNSSLPWPVRTTDMVYCCSHEVPHFQFWWSQVKGQDCMCYFWNFTLYTVTWVRLDWFGPHWSGTLLPWQSMQK